MTTWNAIRIKPWHPFSGPCWRCTCLPVLTLECSARAMQWHLYCQPVLGWGVNLLPWFVRSRAGLRESDTGLTKGTVLVRDGAVQRSDGQAKVDTDLIHPVTRECVTDAADGLPMLWTCHTAAKALHRRCASSPGELGFPGASALGSECGFRWASQSSMQSADISELSDGVPGPFRADAHRRGTVPVLCPLRECSRIVTAWQWHGRSGCSGRLSV